MTNINGKTPSESQVEMTELVLPNDTNLLGNLLGGRLMNWMDLAAGMAASRHSNKMVATVSMDGVDFRHPVRMGEIISLKAKLIWVGRTSMVIRVKAYAESLQTGAIIMSNEATLTFVALDDNQQPSPVPRLLPQTDEEKAEFDQMQEKKDKRTKC